MDLQTVKDQLKLMKQKVRKARKEAKGHELRAFQSGVARLWRRARKLMPKGKKVSAE